MDIKTERRKALAGIFADVAKYTLTAGVLGAFISGNIKIWTTISLVFVAIVLMLLTYFVTPNK